MKKLLILSSILSCSLAGFAQTDAIRIDLNKKGADVSPNLYGIFFEEINHAGDGGLYAELVQNRGFEEHVLPSSMTYVDGKAVAVDSPNYEHRTNRKWSIPWNIEEKIDMKETSEAFIPIASIFSVIFLLIALIIPAVTVL